MKRYPRSILATCVLPWQVGNILDESVFREEIRLLRDNLSKRLYLFGTAGEGYAISDRQFQEIVRIFAAEMDHADAHPMVGVISLSLQTIVERIEFCLAMGIYDIQISLPCWGTLVDEEVDRFFAETCGRFPECRFLHYNLQRSGRLLTGEDYRRLSQAYPNLVAVKDGSTDRDGCLEMVKAVPELQFFFTEQRYAYVHEYAECSLLISLALVNFSNAKEFFEVRGERSAELLAEINGIYQALVDSVGASAHMDGAYDKMLIRTHLPEFPLTLLPPYSAASELCFEKFVSRLPESWRLK